MGKLNLSTIGSSITNTDYVIAIVGGVTRRILKSIYDRKSPEIISPEYTYRNVSAIVSGWQDFCVIGNSLVFFIASSDETHTANDGQIIQIDLTTWLQVGATINHNLGHVNSIHYDPTSDMLLMGNIQGGNFYLVYDFSTKLGADIDFNTTNKTVITIPSGYSGYNNNAVCFGETNYGVRNIVYISGQYNRNWAKLLLGMGANNLGLGTYSAAESNKFNGSFAIIQSYAYTQLEVDNEEVIQGIDYYKGKVITSNGHVNIKGSIWCFDYNGIIQRKIIRNKFFTAAGVEVVNQINEGLTIHNGRVIHGIQGGGYDGIVEYEI